MNDEMSNQLVTRCPCCGVELAIWLSFGESWQENATHDTVPLEQALREGEAVALEREQERWRRQFWAREQERWRRQFWADVDDAFRALGRPLTSTETRARNVIRRSAYAIWELRAPDAAPSFAEWCVEVRCDPDLYAGMRNVGPKSVGCILAAYDAWVARREQSRQGGGQGEG